MSLPQITFERDESKVFTDLPTSLTRAETVILFFTRSPSNHGLLVSTSWIIFGFS